MGILMFNFNPTQFSYTNVHLLREQPQVEMLTLDNMAIWHFQLSLLREQPQIRMSALDNMGNF
jgi:hypothetical protein